MTTEKAIQLLHRLSDSQFDGIHGDERREALSMAVRALEGDGDTISRQAAIMAVKTGALSAATIFGRTDEGATAYYETVKAIKALPSVQPFHNITMNDVLKYIDGMPEDVWQEFTACLECRGWELQRRTAKWCGGEFA